MKLRFSIRDLLWLTLVAAMFLGLTLAWNRSHRREYALFEETNREKLEAQKKVAVLEQQIEQFKAADNQDIKFGLYIVDGALGGVNLYDPNEDSESTKLSLEITNNSSREITVPADYAHFHGNCRC
jgi:hypothetical protein